MEKLPTDLLCQVGKGRMSRRDFLGLAMAGGMTLAAASTLYAGSAMAQEPKRGGHLKLGIGGGASTDSLDPASYSGSFNFLVGHSWGDTLIETHPTTGDAVANLAESWEPSPDATVWRFKIRKDVKFHDGSAMTTADCVATLRRHADEKSQSGAAGLLSSFQKIEDEGGDLVITLDAANADLPLLLTDYHLLIQPKGGAEAPLAAIGTGPYKLKEYQAGVRAAFEKNADDWRSDRGFVDSFEMIGMNDATARVAALSSGQLHFVDMVDSKTVPLMERLPTVQILTSKGKGFYAFLMHCDTAPFDNNDLRLALKYAIDREAMLKQILGGYGSVGNDFPVNDAYALFPEGIEQRVYDPEKARFHYQKSGHSGAIDLRTANAAFPGAVDAAVLFQQNAAAAGIELNIRREPDDGYWTNVWNVQPFCASYWGGRPTQDSRYSTNYISTAEWNDTRFKREDFDKLVLQARGELDTEKRKELYRQIAMIQRDEGGTILPVFNDYINAASKKLMGFVPDIGNDLSNGKLASRVWLES
ncbi:MAG: ABC transporter substrate-binding protein [Paracoccus sp. (in: a-proteobacteria)]|uniref:ABC transporter substrate-binding protein n=1 Tax=Paracoccus sp. TaxID=267 RepID=UPI0039E2B35E